MTTWFKTFEQALETWVPEDVGELLTAAAAEREAFVARFPRAGWKPLEVEAYALGLGGDTVSEWLEYKTRTVCTLPARSAATHLIYRDKTGEWHWPKQWSGLEDAWTAIRAGVVEAFGLAEAGDLRAIDFLEAFQSSRTPLHKLLHLYLPDRILPIAATAHLKHFARRVLRDEWDSARHDKMGHFELGALVLERLRAVERLKGASTDALMRFLYGWCDPRETPAVLKVAPGEGARYWDDCLRGGYIRVGWEELGDLSDRLNAPYSEFKAAFMETFAEHYNGNRSTQSARAKGLWTLATARPGTLILANRGTKHIVGLGRVAKPGYRWLPGPEEYNHAVTVEWDDTVSGEIAPQASWAMTTVQEIPPEEQDELLRPLLESKKPPRPAWIFQCNPKHYRLEDALAHEAELSWRAKQHVGKMGLGHTVYLWRSGPAAAVLATCTITTTPSTDPEPADPYVIGEPEPDSTPWVTLRIDRRLAEPLTKAEIKATPGLDGLGILKMAQGTNYPLTEDEAVAMAALIGGKATLRGPSVEPPVTESPVSFDALHESLRTAGLRFSPTTLSNYLLALQTRRFVLLSGISGTGKTKLAMAIARAFPLSRLVLSTAASRAADSVTVPVRPSNLNHRRIFLPAALATRIPSLADKPGSGKILVHYPGGSETVATWNGTAVHVLLKGKLRHWFEATFAEGDPFEIALVESDDDTPTALRLGRPTAAPTRTVIDNVAVVAVRPDWTDNRGLLGYWNPLLSEYRRTRVLELLLEARDEVARADREGRTPHPFFLVLDEMNLARVEHYFSDFLSCMESGEPVELHADAALAAGEREGAPVPMSLEIPRNLFVTGTVNVDETTYMFSPKVLDRAFTIELNDVHLGQPEGDAADPPLQLDRWGGRLAYEVNASSKDWEVLGSDPHGNAARDRIVQIHQILRNHERPFGYRVAYEMARFVHLARTQASHADAGIAALDLAVLQKVLPKLAGTQQELGAAVGALLAEALDAGSDLGEWKRVGGVWMKGDEPSKPRLPRTADRLWVIRDRLNKHGFAAFVE